MHVEHRNLTWTLILLFLSGVLSNTLKVAYHQQQICAVKGSSVVILCSIYNPDSLKVRGVRWGHVKPRRFKGRVISHRDLRFQYIGDKQHNCSLRIHQVEHNDAGKYIIIKSSRLPGNVSTTLKVVDLNISVSELNGNRTTREGDSVNLTCINDCDGGQLSSAFTWFQNGEPISEGPVLYLSNMSSTNSGNYTCSLNTHTGTTSEVINIDVEYGPKNTSVSVRPSTEVDAGSNMTLICSSHANPPVDSYTWFKIDDDDDGIIDVGYQPVLLSGAGGQYFCRATNTHGSQNSSVVTLKIKAYWAPFTRDALSYTIISAVAALIVTTVIVVRSCFRLKRKRKWTPKTDCEDDIQDPDYVNCLECDNTQSQEGDQCEGGTTELVYATVHFNHKRKSSMEQQVDSHHDEDVIYGTVCRTQLWSPSYIEPL